jgi:cell division protein FtsB
MSEVAEAPSIEAPQENLTQDYIERTMLSAIPESDRKYLSDEPEKATTSERPEKTEKTTTTKKVEKKPTIGDSEIPLDDEPEKAVDEDEDEGTDDDEQPPEEQQVEADKAKAATKWKTYREAYRELPKLKSENEQLKRQVAQLGDQGEVKVLREHVQALATERERLVRLVEQGNIEQSEVWNEHVMGPLNQMWDDIQTISKRNAMDANKVAALLQSGDDVALNDYMEEHNARPGDRNYLFGMIRDLGRVEHTKQYLRANAHELTQRSQQEMLASRDNYFKNLSAQRTGAIERIVPKVEQKILNILPKDKRRNLQEDVKHILDFEKWDPDIQMYAGVSAVVLPDLLDSYNMLRAQLKEAKAELVQLRGGTPRITTGGKTPRAPINGDEEEISPEKLAKTNLTDFADASTKRIRQAMGYR